MELAGFRNFIGRGRKETKATTEGTLAFTCDGAMGTNKRKRKTKPNDASPIITTSLMVRLMRRGTVSILEAVAEELPDVFTAEILPKLNLKDTLNLAQVNKWYNSAVWSVDGVRSIEAKVEETRLGNTKRSKFPMHWATKKGNLPAVRALLESGLDVNQRLTRHKRTALHVAIMFGRAAVMKALIEAGADVNKPVSLYAVDESGTRGVLHNVTPVCYAAQEGNTHIVMELIKGGADVNQATSEGFTPLYIAAYRGHEGIVALLIQAGADVRKACKGGWTPMKIATRKKVVTLLRYYEQV